MTPNFLRDLLIVFGTVTAVMLLLQRLRQSAIIGYLITGIIVGPHITGWVSNREAVDLMAEIGVVVLLFTLGIEFSLKRIEQMRHLVLTSGGLQVALAVAATMVVARLVGLSMREGVFWGLLVALSSTAIVMKILLERGELNAVHGKVSLAILIFQDICVVPMMLFLPTLAPGKPLAVVPLVRLLVQSAVIIMGLLVGARYVFPFLLERVVHLRQKELFLIGILFLAMGTTWIASDFGLSLPLGAFLAGLLLSESEYCHAVLSEILPFRDIFASLFFVSVGMLIDIRAITGQLDAVLGLSAAIVLGKALAAAITLYALQFPPRLALLVGLGLAQVGEFSFILLRQGAQLGLVTEPQYQLFLGATGVTLVLTPLLIAAAPHLAARAVLPARLEQKTRPGVASIELEETHLENHVIVCGYGLNGRLLASTLRANDIPYIVLEVNTDVVRRATKDGERIYYGDCTRDSILLHAGIRSARAIVFAISDPFAVGLAVRVARALNDKIAIIVRTRLLSDLKELYAAGATAVVSEEFEALFEIVAQVMHLHGLPRSLIAQQLESLRTTGYLAMREVKYGAPPLPFVAGGLSVSTVQVGTASPAVGHTVRQLGLREKAGVLVIAVVRRGELISNPTHDFKLEGEDYLVLHGQPEQLQRAEGVLRPGAADVAS